MTLRDQLADTEAQAEHLRRRIAAETCATAGHAWRQIGGKNAGCDGADDDRPDCSCSVPVYECTVCGDSDYGENSEGDAIISACAEARAAEGYAAYAEIITEGEPPEWAAPYPPAESGAGVCQGSGEGRGSDEDAG